MNVIIISTKEAKVGDSFPTNAPNRVMQLTVEGKGNVSATALTEVSNDGKVWFPMNAETTATGVDLAGHAWAPDNLAWAHVRGTITAISGTDAVATMSLGMM